MYQDTLLPNGMIPGERACRERWDLIAPFLPTEGIVVDVGSNLGYYGIQSVRSASNVAVVSIEADPSIAARQQSLLRLQGTNRVCLVRGRMSSTVSGEWAETCDWVQLTLLLSILHWLDDPAKVARDLASMSALLIAEVPDPGDEGACGREHTAAWRDPVEWFRKVTGREARLLGRAGRHTSDTNSHVVLVYGPISRLPRVPYWGSDHEHPDGRAYALEFDGSSVSLKIRGQEVQYIPGINFVSLMRLGHLLHPDPEVWIDSAQAEAARLPNHGDALPHNMLWTARGLRLIDGDDLEFATVDQGIRALKTNIGAWARNRTAAPPAYVPAFDLTSHLRHIVWRVLRLFLSPKAIHRMKLVFKVPHFRGRAAVRQRSRNGPPSGGPPG
jgi:hypothetical protein